jgi:flagellar motor switch protein FliN/FliY
LAKTRQVNLRHHDSGTLEKKGDSAMTEEPADVMEFADELADGADAFVASLKANPDENKTSVDGGMVDGSLSHLMKIPLTLKVILGAVTLPVSALASVSPGMLLPLNRKVGDLVDIVVNGAVIARGELLILEGPSARYGISIVSVTRAQTKEA